MGEKLKRIRGVRETRRAHQMREEAQEEEVLPVGGQKRVRTLPDACGRAGEDKDTPQCLWVGDGLGNHGAI